MCKVSPALIPASFILTSSFNYFPEKINLIYSTAMPSLSSKDFFIYIIVSFSSKLKFYFFPDKVLIEIYIISCCYSFYLFIYLFFSYVFSYLIWLKEKKKII